MTQSPATSARHDRPARLSTAQVEAVVREVVRRLRQSDSGASTAEGNLVGKLHEREYPEVTDVRQDCGVVTIELPVVALATLPSNLDGVRVLHVARRAVVTPAVRDLLRERGIVLQRVGPSDSGPRRCICVDSDLEFARSISQELAAASLCIPAVEAHADVMRTVERLSRSTAKWQLAIVTDRWARVACAANRNPAVSAVHVRDGAELLSARKQMPVNLLVTARSGRSVPQLLGLLGEFFAEATPPTADTEGI